MKHRTFGPGGPAVGEIGLGTWQLGAEWGEVDDDAALAALRGAVAAGTTFLDTADCYGAGLSETRIGAFRRELGADAQRLFVATKVGRFPKPGWPDNLTERQFRAHTEGSLQRLGVEALDLTQTHCLPPDMMKSGEMFEWLRRLQREGKVKRFGASVESIAEAETCLKHDGLASLQIIFNVLRQQPARKLLAAAQARGVAVVVRLPLASGLLSGKFTAASKFPDNDHRHFNRDGQRFNVGETFAGLPFERGLELVEQLRPMAPAGCPLARFALRWVLDHEAVAVAIPGAKSPAQAQENAAASDLPPLPPALHAALRKWHDEQVAPHVRGPV